MVSPLNSASHCFPFVWDEKYSGVSTALLVELVVLAIFLNR